MADWDHSRLVGVRVLVVEDDEGTARPIERYLDEMGAETRTVATSSRANALLAWAELIVLDIELEEGDGLEVAQAAKRMGKACRVIVLTGTDDPDDAFELGRVGVSHYLVKGRDTARLFRTLAETWESLSMSQGGGTSMRQAIDSTRRSVALHALAASDGNIAAAAAQLEISRQALYAILQEKSSDSTKERREIDERTQGFVQAYALTLRQAELLRQIAANTPRSKLAQALGVSENTIKSNVRTLLTKTRCANVAALRAKLLL